MAVAKSGESSETHRFLALDALRGAAAILVLLFHVQGLYGPRVFPHSHLAVDFFFILSGFVLDFAYRSKFQGNILPTREFMEIRFIRLYPVYALGLLLGASAFIVGLPFGVIADPGRAMALPSFVLTAAFLPTPLSETHGTFPLNGPAWSLSVEMLVNFLFALFIARLSLRALCLLVLVADSGEGGQRFRSIADSIPVKADSGSRRRLHGVMRPA